jgi:two-component system LytT family response regulator
VTLRALVVDDEEPARRRLVRLLARLGTVEVVGEADDGPSALAQVRALAPDVVFLDVRMPGMDGITLAQQLGELPAIVFVTAHDSHAVAAFEVEAVDYLLKPVRPERLEEAVARLRARGGDLPAATRALQKIAPPSVRVLSSERGLVRLFDAPAITRFWAADKYTVFRADGEEHLTEESLDALEVRLGPLGFLRIHRSELVRLAAVKALRAGDGLYEVELSDGQVARVSRRSLAEVRRALGIAG